jgi:hypothetical protein
MFWEDPSSQKSRTGQRQQGNLSENFPMNRDDKTETSQNNVIYLNDSKRFHA